MKRSLGLKARALLILSVFGASPSLAQIPCPEMPDKVTQVNRDVRSDVDVQVGSLGKLKAGQLAVKTDVAAKNLFDRYPNVDRLLVVQMMTATYCPMIRDDNTLTDAEKRQLWIKFTDRILKFQNPSYNPTPASPRATSAPAQSAKSSTSDETVRQAQPASPKPAEFYVELYSDGKSTILPGKRLTLTGSSTVDAHWSVDPNSVTGSVNLRYENQDGKTTVDSSVGLQGHRAMEVSSFLVLILEEVMVDGRRRELGKIVLNVN